MKELGGGILKTFFIWLWWLHGCIVHVKSYETEIRGPKLNSVWRCRRDTNSGSQKFEQDKGLITETKCIVTIIRESWSSTNQRRTNSKYGFTLATKQMARDTLSPLNLSRNTTNIVQDGPAMMNSVFESKKPPVTLRL